MKISKIYREPWNIVATYSAIAVAAFFTALSFCCFNTVDSTVVIKNLILKYGVWGARIYRIGTLISCSGIAFCIIAVALFIFYKRMIEGGIKFDFWAIIVAMFFSFSITIGGSYSINNSWEFIFGSKFYLAVSLFCFIFRSMFFFLLVIELFKFIDQMKIRKSQSGHNSINNVKSLFFLIMLLLLVAWMPYIIAFFPGSTAYDGMVQLNMAYGLQPFTNHHPVLSTYLIGLLMKAGQFIWNDYAGMLLNLIVQDLILAGVFSYIVISVYRLDIPKWIALLILLFFAFVPIWGANAQTVTKDMLFVAFFAAYEMLFLKYIESPTIFFSNRKLVISFIVFSLLVCFWRNNGVHIVLLSGAFLLFLKESKLTRVKLISIILIVLFVYEIFLILGLPCLGIKNGSVKEMLSIPFQQTARYIKEYGSEVTEEERERIAKVLPYESIGKYYNPLNADPVKNRFRTRSTKNDLLQYLKVWFLMFFKHPTVYIEATLNNIYGYFYPNKTLTVLGTYKYYSKHELNDHYFDFDYLEVFKNYRLLISQSTKIFGKLPAIGLFTNCGFYTWSLAFLSALILRYRMYRYFVGLIPVWLTVLVCIASPVNAYTRYMLPVMATIPYLYCWVIKRIDAAESPYD